MLYASDFEGDDDCHPYPFDKSKSAQKRAFTLLCSVCWQWCQTLTGWRLKKLIEREFKHFLYIDKCIWMGGFH